jgi:hypothetical protein
VFLVNLHEFAVITLSEETLALEVRIFSKGTSATTDKQKKEKGSNIKSE